MKWTFSKDARLCVYVSGKLLDFLKKIELIGLKKINFLFRCSYQYQIMGFGEDDHTRPLCPYPLYAELRPEKR
jgi:hypothetical protein